MPEPGSPESCQGCSLGRRAFLRDAALAAAALAAAGSRASALPVRFIEALAARGKDVTFAIPAGDSVNFDKANEIILVRTGKSVFAFDLSCPHQNTALRWKPADKRFECPKHHSLYSAEGVYIEGRATRSMDRHAIRHEGGNVIVDLDKIYEEDHDGALWKDAHVDV
jgi:nitrite reductase/ring-hydroxylating ferredoxin subunit